jgi:hypothetical protein
MMCPLTVELADLRRNRIGARGPGVLELLAVSHLANHRFSVRIDALFVPCPKYFTLPKGHLDASSAEPKVPLP